jgi:hypothetical protein
MTANQFRTVYFTEFVNLTDPEVQIFLDWFVLLYGTNYYGAEDRLQGLYTAHRLTIQNQSQVSATGTGGTGAPVGNISMKKEGDVSIAYASNAPAPHSSGDGDFGATSYGIEFEHLMTKFSITGLVSGG